MRTVECSVENVLTRRLTAAVTSVQEILLAVSRLAETGHQVKFTETGGASRTNEMAESASSVFGERRDLEILQ